MLRSSLLLCLAGSVHLANLCAAPVAYDNFESYAADGLNGNNGGSGWEAAWTASSGASVADVSANPLTYDGGAFSFNGGNRAVNITGSFNPLFTREFANIGVAETDEVFFSFMFREESSDGINDFMNLWISNDADRSNSGGIGLLSIADGELGARVIANGSSASTNLSTTDPVNQQTYFLVGRFSRDGTDGDPFDPLRFDLMQLWINPTTTDYALLGTPSASIDASSGINGDISFFGTRTVSIGSGDSYLIDDVRIGTDYLSVVPEPTSAALLLGAAGLLALRVRRR